jgi:hypothetical protein
MCQHEKKCCARLIPAKPGRFRMMQTGFPDFIVFKNMTSWDGEPFWNLTRELINFEVKPTLPRKINLYENIGIEVKSNGYLTKEEKEKYKWLLENNIFSKILIVSKGKKRGEIIYKEMVV